MLKFSAPRVGRRPRSGPAPLCAVLAALLVASATAGAADEPSEAETALFLTDHLQKLTPPTLLRYSFSKTGALEKGFSDTVEVEIGKPDAGAGKRVVTRCLSGDQKVELPALDFAEGNPALLCFLERDIRQMERLTGGKANYFRKRIRLALAEQAQMRAVKLEVNGRPVEAREIRITPYADDPLRARFERFAGKYYVFRVAADIPGGLIEADAVVPDRSGSGRTGEEAPQLIEEVLKFATVEESRQK